jgi:hypothetical protein
MWKICKEEDFAKEVGWNEISEPIFINVHDSKTVNEKLTKMTLTDLVPGADMTILN